MDLCISYLLIKKKSYESLFSEYKHYESKHYENKLSEYKLSENKHYENKHKINKHCEYCGQIDICCQCHLNDYILYKEKQEDLSKEGLYQSYNCCSQCGQIYFNCQCIE